MSDALLYYCLTTEEEEQQLFNAQRDERLVAPSAAFLPSLIPDWGQNVITVVGYLMW